MAKEHIIFASSIADVDLPSYPASSLWFFLKTIRINKTMRDESLIFIKKKKKKKLQANPVGFPQPQNKIKKNNSKYEIK